MLAKAIKEYPPSVGCHVAIGIDGCGGAGKSSLAATLCQSLPDCQVIPTDDFASWDEPLEWWKRMLRQIFLPLQKGLPARYQRYNWTTRALEEWVDVRSRILLIEGVSSTRREFRPFLAARVWVECPRALRLERGLLRDGPAALPNWELWMAHEDAYVADHQPSLGADFVIRGDGGERSRA